MTPSNFGTSLISGQFQADRQEKTWLILLELLKTLRESRGCDSGFPMLAATHGRPEPGGGCAADNRSLCPPYEHSPGAGSANGADALKSLIGPVLPAVQSSLQAVQRPIVSPFPSSVQSTSG